MGISLRIDGSVCWFWALLLLLVPLKWLLAAFLAAVVHEIAHAVAVALSGGRVRFVRIGPMGAEMESRDLTLWGECISALAGPAGSFLLLLGGHVWPLTAVCGFFQGMYNLLPVYPLDGGRALRCLLVQLLPNRAERIGTVVEVTVLSFIFIGTLVFCRELLLIPASVLIRVAILRKRP